MKLVSILIILDLVVGLTGCGCDAEKRNSGGGDTASGNSATAESPSSTDLAKDSEGASDVVYQQLDEAISQIADEIERTGQRALTLGNYLGV